MTAPDDVATPERMTPERRQEIERYHRASNAESVRNTFGAGSWYSIGDLLAELRAVEAQLAERDAEIARLRTAVEHFSDNAPISLHPHRGDCVGCDAILAALKEHDDA